MQCTVYSISQLTVLNVHSETFNISDVSVKAFILIPKSSHEPYLLLISKGNSRFVGRLVLYKPLFKVLRGRQVAK